MKQMNILPTADCLCREGQQTAWLRPYTMDWNTPESDSLHLEYSYNKSDWYQLNGGNGVWFPDFGSGRITSPALYLLENHGYLVTAGDAENADRRHLVRTEDFIHYTGASYTGSGWEISASYQIKKAPLPDGSLEIPLSVLKELQAVYGKPEPVLLHAVEDINV